MRMAACLVTLALLLEKPSFTSEEAREAGVRPAVLCHYVKTGRLKRVRRGVYQSVNYYNAHAFRWEDLIEAVYSIKAGVVCLTSALAVYDLTEEIPRQHWIAIRHGTSVKTPRSLKIVRYRDMQLGKTEIEVEGVKIPIFDRERTIIDAFRLLSRETAIKALKAAVGKGGKNRIDFVKLQAYAKKLRFNIAPLSHEHYHMNEQAFKYRLSKIAQEKGIHVNACWKQLLLERFLARLAGSTHSHKFIFKGGFLLSYLLKIGRETTDLDFLLTRMLAEEKKLQETFEQIISIHSADGFTFSVRSIEPMSHAHMNYPGYRVVLNASFAKRKDIIQVDLGVGDAVEPLTREIQLVQYEGKPFFENVISLLVYPAETIFAEKLETIISKGINSTRMKDYHDLILLLRNKEMLNLEKLSEAIGSTFSNRSTLFRPISFDEAARKSLQSLWTAHMNGLGDVAQDLNLPKDLSALIEEINNYCVRSYISK